MRKLFVVERRDHTTVVASDEEGAIDEAHAMFVEGADESLDCYEVLGSYDEAEAEDVDMAEWVGGVKALETTLDWITDYEVGLSPEATIQTYDVIKKLKASLNARVTELTKKLAELLE